MSVGPEGPGWWQASDGRFYPPQQHPAYLPPPPVPRRSGHGCLIAMGVVGAVFVVLFGLGIALVAVGSRTVSKSTPSLGGPPPKASYRVGDTAATSGLNVTVYAFRDPQPPKDAFNTPTAGNHFVSVDVQVANPGTDQQAFSSLIAFHLLDAQNRQYDEDITNGGLSPGAPDGQIAGGQSIRGFVVFEVPDGTTGLRFRAQGSVTAAGAVFVL